MSTPWTSNTIRRRRSQASARAEAKAAAWLWAWTIPIEKARQTTHTTSAAHQPLSRYENGIRIGNTGTNSGIAPIERILAAAAFRSGRRRRERIASKLRSTGGGHVPSWTATTARVAIATRTEYPSSLSMVEPKAIIRQRVDMACKS